MGVGPHTLGEKRAGRRRRSWWILLCLLLVAAGGASASVTMAEAQGANAPPVANDNAYQVKRDGTRTVPAAGVLKNDLDPDGDALSAARDSSPRHGRLTLRSDGSFVYAPDKGYRGKDSFTYSATDAAGGADTATVEITVWAGERPPLARDDAYGIDEDGTLTVPARGVLMNDRESDGRRLFATKVTDPAHGSLSLGRDGSFVYTPDEDYSGDDSFTYRARDGRGREDKGAVRISVDAINDAPVYTDAARNTSQTIDEGANLAALEATDADGDTLAFELTSGSLPPGITLENGGGFTGPAGGRAAGNYTANIKVSDGNGETATTALAVTVNGVEEAAVADDVNVATDEDTDKTITLSATDADTDNLTFSVASPAHGTLGTPSAPDCTTSAGAAACTTTVVYTPDADYNGPDSFTYTAGDSEPATVNITVNAVNDEPVARADTKTTPENTPLVFPASDLLVNDSKGAANEDAQELSVDSVSDPAGGTVVLNNDEITFTPTADYNGPASFKYTVCDSGSPQECSTQTATVNVTVSPVNSTPTASATPGSLDIDEDAATQTVRLAGADTETGAANLRFTITEAPAHGVLKKDTTALGNGDGFTGSPTDVTYKPDADYNGSDSFKFEVTDRGDPDNCGTPAPACAAQESDAMTVPITVNSVVDPVTISSGGTLAYTENDPPTPVDDGLEVTDPEGAQISQAEVRITTNYQNDADVLAFSDNEAGDNITLDPGSAGATLTLTGADSAANYQAALRAVTYENTSESPSGLTRTVSFTATDGNSVASAPATRDIAVTPVEDPPVAVDDSATVDEDAAATNVPVLDNDTDPDGGPKTISSASDPANGTVAVTGGSPGAHTGLTYTPDANYCNDPPGTNLDTFTYTINGGSTGTVSMTVTCVNDAPVADNESFNGSNGAVGNTALIGNDPSDGAPSASGPKKTVSGDLLDGDTDVDGPGPLEVVAGTFATNDGGSVTIESDGDFTYVNDPADTCADTSDFFDYTVTDKNAGTAGTDTGQVNVSIAGCVWYVNNNASGNSGISSAPFDTLAQAQTASGAGHTIFVFDGDNTTSGYGAGIDLKANQKLIGEAANLTVGSDTLHTGDPSKRPTLTDTNDDVVALDDANEVRGLGLDPQGTGGGIAGATGDTGGGTIDDVRIIDNGTTGTQPGLELDSTTGTFNISNLVVNNAATGVRLHNTTTSTNTVNAVFNPASQISITSNGGPGLDVDGTVATPVNLGTSTFDDITVTNSNAGGVNITNATGTTTFGDGSGTDLALTTNSGANLAFGLTNAGTVAVPSGGTANVSATGGPAVDISGTSTNATGFNFDDVDSTGSSTDGINLDGLGTGTFSATSGDIGGASGIAFDLNGGSGNITYPGNLGNGSGQTAEITGRSGGAVALSGQISDNNDAGGGISMSTNTGGTITFSGTSKVLNTGSATAFSSTGSAHTINFSGGGLDIDTTSATGFSATGGGTVNVTGTGNSITSTTTGTALNVANTTIGGSNLNFQSISAGPSSGSGPANAIVLNNTGSSGGLTVTGGGNTSQGGDNSGGTIQNTTGDGISLVNTTGPSFNNMNLQTTTGHGINGTQVANFGFTNGKINGAGTASDHSCASFDDLEALNVSGTFTFTNNQCTQTEANGVDVQTWGSTLSDVNISNNLFTDTGDVATPGSAVLLIGNASASAVGVVTKATLANNTITDFRAGAGFVLQANSSGANGVTYGTAGHATNVISVTGNLMNGGNGGIGNQPDRFITGGVNGRGQGNYDVSNNGTAANRIRNIDCIGIELQADGIVNMTSKVQNNFINPNSAVGCAGIAVGTDDPNNVGAGTHTTTISGNDVMGTDGPGIFPIIRDSGSTMTARVLNNTVAAPITTNAARAGIRVDSGSAEGDTTLCLEISGNTTAGSTNTGTGTTSPGINLRKQGTDPNVNTFGIEGMAATSSPGVENYVNGLNTSTSGTFGTGGTALLSAASGFTNCNAP